VALIADSSNREIDMLNARAQHLRAQRGELDADELPLSSVHYGLRQGDGVAFIAQHRPQGQPRVENGTRGQVTNIDQEGRLTLALDGSDRRLQLARHDAESLRLAYAQHVYRQQGATVDRSVVLTGGWQTSRETAYVQATRARHGTDWYIARDQLGQEGQDPDRIANLARQMSNSRAHEPSILHPEMADRGWSPQLDPLRIAELTHHLNPLRQTQQRDSPEHDVDHGYER
jgi:ATP-dependent exoDNAse (exonuclease V) alpha subunit